MDRPALKISVGLAAAAGMVIAIATFTSSPRWSTKCSKPWVFFDLGDTIVHATPGKPMSYVAGAREHLLQLKERGYRIGLITNVPEIWGRTSKEKIANLKRTLESEWSKDPAMRRMDWSDFSEALIFVPPSKEYRKPSPYLFRAALARVALEEGETGCNVIYESENAQEVAAARREGMTAYQVGSQSDSTYLPIDEIDRITLTRSSAVNATYEAF